MAIMGKMRKVQYLLLAMGVIIGDVNAQLADGKCKFLGNIIAGNTPSNFTTYWNQVTPENGGKWGSVESTRDVMNWGALDLAYNTARNNEFPFKQHTLVWGQQQPNWIGTLTEEEQREEVEEWIQLFCERYPDTDYIDVVNEPLHAIPNYAGALDDGTGLGWVVWAFEKARQYCPNAKLILNDYNIISNNSSTDQYLTLINLLKDKGLIDIIGEQGHFLETTPNETILSNLDKLYATGLPIHISEYDVNLADDNEQHDKYMSQFPVLWTHPGVHGITFWGYKQGEIWRTDAYLLRSNGTERPALTWLKGYVPANTGGTFCLTTGLEDELWGTNIFPNPSSDGKFFIESERQNVSINVYDLQGRMIGHIKLSNQETGMLQMNSGGMYLLEISDGVNTTFERVMVIK